MDMVESVGALEPKVAPAIEVAFVASDPAVAFVWAVGLVPAVWAVAVPLVMAVSYAELLSLPPVVGLRVLGEADTSLIGRRMTSEGRAHLRHLHMSHWSCRQRCLVTDKIRGTQCFSEPGDVRI